MLGGVGVESYGAAKGVEVKVGEGLRKARVGAKAVERLKLGTWTVVVVGGWFGTKACA